MAFATVSRPHNGHGRHWGSWEGGGAASLRSEECVGGSIAR